MTFEVSVDCRAGERLAADKGIYRIYNSDTARNAACQRRNTFSKKQNKTLHCSEARFKHHNQAEHATGVTKRQIATFMIGQKRNVIAFLFRQT